MRYTAYHTTHAAHTSGLCRPSQHLIHAPVSGTLAWLLQLWTHCTNPTTMLMMHVLPARTLGVLLHHTTCAQVTWHGRLLRQPACALGLGAALDRTSDVVTTTGGTVTTVFHMYGVHASYKHHSTQTVLACVKETNDPQLRKLLTIP